MCTAPASPCTPGTHFSHFFNAPDGNRRLRFGFYVLFHIFIIVLINFNAFTSKTRIFFFHFFSVFVYCEHEWILWKKETSTKKNTHTQNQVQKLVKIIQVTLSNIFFWGRWDSERERESTRDEHLQRLVYVGSFRNSQIYEVVRN